AYPIPAAKSSRTGERRRPLAAIARVPTYNAETLDRRAREREGHGRRDERNGGARDYPDRECRSSDRLLASPGKRAKHVLADRCLRRRLLRISIWAFI